MRVKLLDNRSNLVTWLDVQDLTDVITWQTRVFVRYGVDTHPQDPRESVPAYHEATHYQAPPSPPEMRFG